MSRVSASGDIGLVAANRLSARECVRVLASTSRHARLRVRIRREDYAVELGRLAGAGDGEERAYELLVSTGRGDEVLELDAEEELTVHIPVLVAGRREVREVLFEVQRVRAVVAGLRGSECIHRALVSVAEREP